MHALGLLGELGVVPDAKKIAVLRANGIGDYIFALPALDSLKAAYPQAELVLLGAPWHARELPRRPGPVSRVIVVPPQAGIREPEGEEQGYASAEELQDFFDRMRAERFDLVIQLHGGGRNSNPLVLRLGARVTAGMRTPDAAELDRSIPHHFFHPEVLRFLEVVGLVGAPPVRLLPSWEPTPADREAAGEFFGRAGAGPYILLSPGAGDPRRRWPPSMFAQLADALAEQGAVPILVGGWSDRSLVRQVRDEADCDFIDASGRCDLGVLSAVMERASLFVGNDSGPLHLARAVGTPTVGIYWCGNLINAGPMFSAWHRSLASWRLDCPSCGANCMESGCDCDSSFVRDVPLDDVLAASLELWSRSKQKLLCAHR